MKLLLLCFLVVAWVGLSCGEPAPLSDGEAAPLVERDVSGKHAEIKGDVQIHRADRTPKDLKLMTRPKRYGCCYGYGYNNYGYGSGYGYGYGNGYGNGYGYGGYGYGYGNNVYDPLGLLSLVGLGK